MPILDQNVDRWMYIKILGDGLVGVLQEVQDTLRDPVFQQGNALIHTADTMA